MSRAEVQHQSVSGFKLFLAFITGIGIGLLLVWPVLPDDLGERFAMEIPKGGEVILVGVLALAILAVLVAIIYRIYLTL